MDDSSKKVDGRAYRRGRTIVQALRDAMFILILVLANLCIGLVGIAHARPACTPPDDDLDLPIHPDCLALLTIYLELDGENWGNDNRWLSMFSTLTNGRGYLDEDGNPVGHNFGYGVSVRVVPGEGPEGGAWYRIKGLALTDNSLTGELPAAIGTMDFLETLDLRGNNLTGAIPASIGELDALETLDLRGNNLTGAIPASIGRLDALETLDLSVNRLSETIPSTLGNLRNLRTLNLGGPLLLSDPYEYNRVRGNHISGSIPSALGNLRNLEYLNLSAMSLTGSIPPELGNLRKLSILGLRGHGSVARSGPNAGQTVSLSGQIPAELGNLHNLHWMDLRLNALSGEIPAAVATMGSLHRVRNYYLTPLIDPLGNTPNDRFYATAAELLCLAPDFSSRGSGFWLNYCNDEDRPALEAIYRATDGPNWSGNNGWLRNRPLQGWEGVETDDDGRVIWLGLHRNGLSGAIPAQLGDLSSLTQLRLDGNALTGVIPAELGNLSNLTQLSLDGNALTGVIPAELGNLSNLTSLSIDSDTGLCLAQDFPLTSPFGRRVLEYYDISICGDHDLLGELYRATGGANWTNSANWLSDKPLAEWYGVTADADGRVTALILPSNGLSGEIPASVGGLAYVARVDLSGNPDVCLAPDFPLASPFGREASRDVPICDDSEDREALEALYNATNGPQWTNSTNWLTDEALSEWYGVTTDSDGRVTNLALPFNGLQGSIPAELGNLTNLTSLVLSPNALVGHIPSELGKLTNLSSLVLSDNMLTGQIPGELGNLTNLTHLLLHRNELSGAVPAALGNLTNLNELGLSFNYDLSGPLPEGLLQTGAALVNVSATNTCVADERTWSAGIAAFWPSGLICGDETIVEVDVLVFYTPAALEALTPPDEETEMEATIKNRVMYANAAFSMSRVHLRLGKVYSEKLEFVEEGDIGKTLDLFFYSKEVKKKRNMYGADLVHLIVGGNLKYLCGIGYSHLDEFRAYSVSHVDMACTSSFVHELGHNMGLWHDRYTEVTTGGFEQEYPLYPYSHGYVNQRAFGVNVTGGVAPNGTAECWYTIMAYSGQCTALQGSMELPLFSNPRMRYFGDPLGITDWYGANRLFDVDGSADAVRSLNRTRHTVSRFRRRAALSPEQTQRFTDTWQVQVLESGTAASRVASGAVSFTDYPVGMGTIPVKARHFGELRARIAALRAREGLPAVQWTDPILVAGVTPVKRAHLTELRAALDEVYTAAGHSAPGYTDATVMAGATPIKAVHLEELRAAVLAVDTGAEATAGIASRSRDVEEVTAATGARGSEQQRGEVFVAAGPETTVDDWRPRGSGGVAPEPLALRRRLVQVDIGVLARTAFRPDDATIGPARLVLNLFDDVVVTGIIEQWEQTLSGGFALSGGIEGTALGTMTLVVNGSVVVGTIWTPDGTYWIEPAGEGAHAISERNPAVRIREAPRPTVNRLR